MRGNDSRYKHIFMSSLDSLGTVGSALPLRAGLAALRAVSEETRLRMLALLAEGELSVSDLTDILGQSQPRISRHLKVLVEAGLLERHREGAWAFFRLADAPAGGLLRPILAGLDPADRPLAEDRERLRAVRAQRAQAAQAFFARLAPRWDEERSRHVAEEAVEDTLLSLLGPDRIGSLLDLGTGTGRMLQLLGPQAERAVGLDASHAMLSVARANLEKAGIAGVDFRQGDIYAPPLVRASFDVVLVHQVLHYLDDPGRALSEAARLVAPGGRLLVVDFAPHAVENLREAGAHRRLGFSHEQMAAWMTEAGCAVEAVRDLAPPSGRGDGLTVSVWIGRSRSIAAARAAQLSKEFA